jgi:hypothetical protein
MKWIILSFILFTVFIGTLVTICVREDVSLVSVNYYQEELVHQDKIDRQRNMQELKSYPVIGLSNQQVKISYPTLNQMSTGELRLTRPSDSKLDQRFQLSKNEEQQFQLAVSEKGLYRVSLQWTMNGKEYYFEKLIVL